MHGSPTMVRKRPGRPVDPRSIIPVTMRTFPNPTSRMLILFLVQLGAISSGIAEMLSTTKDGITIAAEAALSANGKTHITCTLTNRSLYTLASLHTGSASPCFQLSMLDDKDDRVPQEETWFMVHRQEEWNDTNDHRSYNEVWIAPSKSREFQFDLEDAYGERTTQGRTLIVKWKNFYSGPETNLEIREMKGADGQVVPAHREPVHFPGLWTVSVTLPLPKKVVQKYAVKSTDLSSANPPPENTSQEIPINKAHQLTTNTPRSSTNRPSPWWWGLIAIPLLLFAWLGLRLRKQP
jgi:hypothetical protein